jgi:Uri superfamily endonuclease
VIQAGRALPILPGTYAVLLEPLRSGTLGIGRLGELDLSAACLVYVGSALGPGGIAARCAHHLRLSRRPHWHLDWLRPACRVRAIWYALNRERCEHQWAAALALLAGAPPPLPGFGASDCRCPAHLYAFPSAPHLARFADALAGLCPGQGALTEVSVGPSRTLAQASGIIREGN